MFNLKILTLPTLFLALFVIACATPAKKVPEMDLLTAIDKEKIEIINQHMIDGTTPNSNPIPDGFEVAGAYPLHLAVLKGNVEIIKILIDNGADLDKKARNKDEAPPLTWAAWFMKKTAVSILINEGAAVNQLDANESTALDAANYALLLSDKDPGKKKVFLEILD